MTTKSGLQIIGGTIAVALVIFLIGKPSANLAARQNLANLICEFSLAGEHHDPSRDDLSHFERTTLTCNQSLQGLSVRLASVSDPIMPIDHSRARIDKNTFSLGYNLLRRSHHGWNIVEATFTLGAAIKHQRFEFLIDAQSPDIQLTKGHGTVNLEVFDTHSAIKAVTATLELGDNDYKTIDLLQYTASTLRSSNPRRAILEIPSAQLLGVRYLLTAVDLLGNSTDLLVGNGDKTEFLTKLEAFHDRQSEEELRLLRAAQMEQGVISSRDYYLNLAVVYMSPSGLPDAERIERIKRSFEGVENGVRLLANEFIRNNLPLPDGFVDETLQRIGLYIRDVGSTTVKRVDRAALNNGQLIYTSMVNDLPAFGHVIQSISGKYSIEQFNSYIPLGEESSEAFQSKVLEDLTGRTEFYGRDRFVVTFDKSIRLDGKYYYTRSFALSLHDQSNLEVGEVFVHELGHSCGLFHTSFSHSEVNILHQAGFNSLSVSAPNSKYLNIAQINQIKARLFGDPSTIQNADINHLAFNDSHFAAKWSHRMSGNEEFSFIELMHKAATDPTTLPPYNPASHAWIPPWWSENTTVSNAALPLLPDRLVSFPKIVYRDLDEETKLAKVAGHVDHRTGRLHKSEQSKSTITCSRPNIYIGYIPLAGGGVDNLNIFEPFYTGPHAQRRQHLRALTHWRDSIAERVASVQIPCRPGDVIDFTSSPSHTNHWLRDILQAKVVNPSLPYFYVLAPIWPAAVVFSSSEGTLDNNRQPQLFYESLGD